MTKQINDDSIQNQNGEGGENQNVGGSVSNEGNSDNGNGGESKDDSKNTERTFTQEQVSKMMAREKKQGRNSAFNELGIDQSDSKAIEAFKAFMAAYNGADDGSAAVADNGAVADAENRAMVAEMKAEALMQGVQKEYVEDLVTLALAKMTDDSDMKTIVSEFRTKYPVWFGEVSDDSNSTNKGTGDNVGQKGTGSSIKNQSANVGKDDKGGGMGARLAAQRKAKTAKQSYWGGK